jgi:hypothetical protein
MIERTEARFGIKPEWLAADTAYGTASNLDWLVNEQGIAPHVPVINKSKREDGTFSRGDFIYDEMRNIYTCPAGKTLTPPAMSAPIMLKATAPHGVSASSASMRTLLLSSATSTIKSAKRRHRG